MGKTLIFGHKNPDTDSICSALAYADLKARSGADVEAVRLGTVSAETQFVLDTIQHTGAALGRIGGRRDISRHSRRSQ